MPDSVFRGTIPALMTPCTPDRRPDFAALVRKGKELVGAGMSGVVYCGSMGDWPLLDDEQRMEGAAALAKAGVPLVVGTGAQNPRRAAALAAHAKKIGAKGLMVIPRVLSRGPSVAAQRAHFEAILEAGEGVPAVIYNSPYYGYETRADLFFELRRKHANLVGFKEFGGAKSLSYAAEHITGADPSLMLLVGVDTQVFHGYVNCGAVGAITGIGNVLPKPVLELVALCTKAAAGDVLSRRRARELEQALMVLSTFDEGPDLVLFYKYLMVLEGNPEYELQLDPTDGLSDSQRHFARTQLKLFKDWYARWSAMA
ncbi:MAG: dihydrodipicolinate synthase family protein [Alphaproteobacteria bacterium]|nr:dihydrodipicolinate synthase family protein [Alphaproteobacteria bacterium]